MFLQVLTFKEKRTKMVKNITPWNTISIVMKPGYMESSSTVNAATLFFWTMFLKPSLRHTFLFTFYMTILKHTGTLIKVQFWGSNIFVTYTKFISVLHRWS